jgi:hypothetical protein
MHRLKSVARAARPCSPRGSNGKPSAPASIAEATTRVHLSVAIARRTERFADRICIAVAGATLSEARGIRVASRPHAFAGARNVRNFT